LAEQRLPQELQELQELQQRQQQEPQQQKQSQEYHDPLRRNILFVWEACQAC